MDELIRELKARKIPQYQGSLTEQLLYLKAIANAVGLYDAADTIKLGTPFIMTVEGP